MPSIIHTAFRVSAAKAFINSISIDNYYIGLGKVLEWQPDDLNPSGSDLLPNNPIDRINESYTTKRNIFGLKKITSADVCLGIPRHDWTTGTVYTQYTDDDEVLFEEPYFVLTSEYKLYKCFYNNNGAMSTVEPVGGDNLSSAIVSLADGYKWKFMGNVAPNDILNFLMADYVPVRDNAFFIKGQIASYRITNGGVGYNIVSLTVKGNGTGATATANLLSGAIESINVTSYGTNYTYADVIVGGDGAGAVVSANLSPTNGHGYSIVNELSAVYVLLSVKIEFDESTDFLTNNDFRQVSIVKNPLDFSDVLYTSSTANCTHVLDVDDVSGFSNDDEIVIRRNGDDIGTATVANIINATTITITDFRSKSLLTGDTIHSVGNAIINTITPPEVNIYTGELIYTGNRTPVTRDVLQSETIKIPFEF